MWNFRIQFYNDCLVIIDGIWISIYYIPFHYYLKLSFVSQDNFILENILLMSNILNNLWASDILYCDLKNVREPLRCL